MAKTLTKDMTVGSMVAEDFKRAEVFEHLGIDYCCHGSDTLEAACAKQNLKPEDVLDRLDRNTETTTGSLDFSAWPLDLLLDYVLKKHHRNFHLHHEALMQLVEKVERAHGGRHPELHEVRAAVAESFAEARQPLCQRGAGALPAGSMRCMRLRSSIVRLHRSIAEASPSLFAR